MRHRQMKAVSVALAALACIALSGRSAATVTVSGPDDGSAFFPLVMPTGEFDERGLSGFEFIISSRTGEFRENDLYLISGQATEETTSIANELGTVDDLSGVPFFFSIQHNLAGGRNFTFSVTDGDTLETSILCWGLNCEPRSNATEILDGIPPIFDYNGLQVQARAQEIVGSSVELQILSLTGVDVVGEDFFDETVTPLSPGTLFVFDFGRRGQWMMADSLDLVLNEWELTGMVTLNRPDSATSNLTKVRLAVDLVRDPNLAFIPEPGAALPWCIVFLYGLGRRRASRAR
jgi:hypothetical protein